MVRPGEDQSTTAGQGNPTLAASGAALTLVERLRARYEETDKPVSQKINIMIRERKEAADRIDELVAAANSVMSAKKEIDDWMALGYPARVLVPEPSRATATRAFADLSSAIARAEGRS